MWLRPDPKRGGSLNIPHYKMLYMPLANKTQESMAGQTLQLLIVSSVTDVLLRIIVVASVIRLSLL